MDEQGDSVTPLERAEWLSLALKETRESLDDLYRGLALPLEERVKRLSSCYDRLEDCFNVFCDYSEDVGLIEQLSLQEKQEAELREIIEGLLRLAPESVARQKLFRRYRKLDEQESDRPQLTIVPTNEGVTPHAHNH